MVVNFAELFLLDNIFAQNQVTKKYFCSKPGNQKNTFALNQVTMKQNWFRLVLRTVQVGSVWVKISHGKTVTFIVGCQGVVELGVLVPGCP